MTRAHRVRVEFLDDAATDMMVEWGFSRVVFPIDESMKCVSDLLHGIVQRFGVSNRGYDVLLGDFSILPSDKIEGILQPDDVLSLRPSSAASSTMLLTKADKKKRDKQKPRREKLKEVPAHVAPQKEEISRRDKIETKRIVAIVKATKPKDSVSRAGGSTSPKKRPCPSETVGRERKKKRSRKIVAVDAPSAPPANPPVAPPPQKTIATSNETHRKGHVRFDAVSSSEPTTQTSTSINNTTQRKPTDSKAANSTPVVRERNSKPIPVELQKYGPRHGAKRQEPAPPLPPQTSRRVDENQVRPHPAPPRPAPVHRSSPPSEAQPKAPRHSDATNEVWKRPYTVIASVKRSGGSDKKTSNEEIKVGHFPMGEASTVEANDVVAFKTVALCEVRFEPIVSAWKVGKVLSRTATDVSIQVCRHFRDENDVTWQEDDEVSAFNLGDFAEIRLVQTTRTTETTSVEEPHAADDAPLVEEDDADDLLEALRRRKEELLAKASL